MRIGIFGGTFDPIHLGHLIVAEAAREALDMDHVLFIPTGRPYFKVDREVTGGRERLAMVKLAVESNPSFRASEMEIERPGPTYTVDTLEVLRTRLGTSGEMFVILGMDSLSELDRWRRPESVLDMSTVVGVARPGARQFDRQMIERIRAGASAKVIVLEGPLIGIGASDIRRRVAAGLSIKHRVPEPVEAYIYEHGLYKAKPRGEEHAG